MKFIRVQTLNRNRSSIDWDICWDLLSTKSRQKWIYRGVIEDLSMAKTPRWIENPSRIYQLDREFKKLARWIEEVVEILSRRNLESLMDWDFVKICQEKKKKGLNRREFVEKLLRLKKKSFSKKGKTHRDECNKQATQT